VTSRPTAPADAAPFCVLTVCTGNVCRSPAAERLLLARLGDGAGVVVSSAGTHALAGAPMTPQTAELVVQHGGDPGGFRARQLDADLVTRADLVLTMTRAHRAAVVDLAPRAVGYTFTLRELARIVATLPSPVARHVGRPASEHLRSLRDVARGRRAAPADPADDDVSDPYGRGGAAYGRTFDELVPAIDALTAAALPAHRSL